MKILWVKTDFLHPTDRGGQIRTLETLRRLHERHEVHYLAYDNPAQPEGLTRAKEYCSFAYPVEHHIPEKSSPAFAAQLVAGLISPLPVAVARWKSKAFEQQLKTVLAQHKFDSIVCDFLFPAPNFADLSKCTLFQHNVEAMIWDRHAQHGRTPLHRWYFGMQARRMAAYERQVCLASRNVIAVSEADAVMMRERYGVSRIAAVPTGVDTDFFLPSFSGCSGQTEPIADLVFLGSMDWMPNIDGMQWFADEIWPLILAKRPGTTLAIVGRKPTPAMVALGDKPGIRVTGTVPDVRPWLHGSKISIVPLRIGGGTRLKIYESMAARVPVISTTVGAEGLDYRDGETIRIVDNPALFAGCCLAMLDDVSARERMAKEAWELVAGQYSWQAITAQFERYLV
jgi:polysaccharide biosynthesis protein PslH